MAAGNAFTDTHQAAWIGIVRASERILQTAGRALKAAGLPPLVWYDLLLELKKVKPDGLRHYQLQERMLMPQYNMSRLVERLVREGYVDRFECDDDGRGQVVTITAAGLALQKRMWPVYRAVLETEIAGRLSETEARNLAVILSKLGD